MVVAVLCGGGNGAHVLAGIGSSQPDTAVRVFTLFADEAERWTKAMEGIDFSVTCHSPGADPVTIVGIPAMVTKDPAKCVPGADIIIITVPAFAHQGYLDALKPHVKPGAVVVGLPGQPGFEFAVRGCWGDLSDQCTILSFDTLPWAARIKEFGRSVEVLGTKDKLMGAVQNGSTPPVSDPTAMLQGILGPLPKLATMGHLIGITLNAHPVHPAIMYGRWHDWDGELLDEAPLFYQGLDENSANIMSTASDELLEIVAAIKRQRDTVDLSNVCHVFDWYLSTYPEEISDKSSLYNAIRTNSAYIGLKHPMAKSADDKLQPDFKHRYFTEDIPYGLVVMRGIAEVAGVETPCMDTMLIWCQQQMGKGYLVDGKVQGKHVAETRAPQRYGLTTLDGMLGKM